MLQRGWQCCMVIYCKNWIVLKWLENISSFSELHRLHCLDSYGYLGDSAWTSRSVPELMEYVVWVPTCSRVRLKREWMSASHTVLGLRNLQARIKVSFSELSLKQAACLSLKFSKRSAVFGRHVQLTLGLKLHRKSSHIKSQWTEQHLKHW